MEEFMLYGSIIAIVGIFAMRWLLSWWVRITDVLKELRLTNQKLATLIQCQRDTLTTMQTIQYIESQKTFKP